MKIIVIGIDPMGKHRIRLLSEYQDVEIFGIDNQRSSCVEVGETFGVKCFNSISEAVKNQSINVAVISTFPLSHAAIHC